MPGQQVWVAISDQEIDGDPAAWAEAERRRRERLVADIPPHQQVRRRLVLAADQFLVHPRPGKTSVIAGYPWFTDWGRDTMIALPGLTLTTGRFEEARRVLAAFVEVMDQGLIPNNFGDESAQPAYNTVDATLWMFVAAWRYAEASGDLDFVRDSLYEPLCESLHWHLQGTHNGIKADSDGLLTADLDGCQGGRHRRHPAPRQGGGDKRAVV